MTPSERKPPSLPRSDSASRGAQRLTPEELDALKRTHPIEQIAAAYDLTLTRVGPHLVGLCPLHRETRPSFTVYPQSGTFYCFGCRQGCDVIELVRRLEGVGFVAAVERLDVPRLMPRRSQRPPIERAATALPDRERQTEQDEDDRARRLLAARASPAGQAALDLAMWVYHQTLLQSAPAQAYLATRGIRYPVAQRCRVGCCTGDRLVSALRHQSMPLEAAWAVGLLSGPAGRERFAGRITIPEIRCGHILWLTGRLLDRLADARRYMSLPGPRPLLGADTIAGHPNVVGVEGSMDWLTLVGWGLPDFAALGGALSREAFAALAQAQTIYLAFDRDGPGQEAARAPAARLDGRARRVLLPEGVKDVNELGQHPDGWGQFRTCLLRAAHPSAPASPADGVPEEEAARWSSTLPCLLLRQAFLSRDSEDHPLVLRARAATCCSGSCRRSHVATDRSAGHARPYMRATCGRGIYAGWRSSGPHMPATRMRHPTTSRRRAQRFGNRQAHRALPRQ